MNRLPIGIQTFSNIIRDNQIYIDKTEEALDLVENYKYAFLSRPRRFGKSLFIDTLQEIFEGNREIFKNLYIYDKYDFESYPVIKIDWAGNFKTLQQTEQTAKFILKKNQERLGVECELNDDASICFATLIIEAYKKYQKPVVVLIDEYDKPILDNIEDTQRALENRDFLRGIYIQLKAHDEYIKFAFLTGITKFSKASIFSGLNNIEDISLHPNFGNICGYTQKNIEDEFYEYSQEFDLKKIKEWYNGYDFLKDKIYNPFDVLKLFKNKSYKNYWWESGNPYFLITLLKKQNYYIPNLENIKLSEDLLNTFEVDKLKLEVLLYQSGYLTIDKVYEKRITQYSLKVPNKEVQMSLNNLFIDYLTEQDIEKLSLQDNLYDALEEGNLAFFQETLSSLFASIAYNNFTNNDIQNYEGYYASVVYAYLASLGLEIVAEDVTNRGRIDLTLFIEEKIYIIEFKINSDDALKQIKEREYHQKYLSQGKEIYLVGIGFDTQERNLSSFEWEMVSC